MTTEPTTPAGPTQPQPWTCPECGGAWIRNYVFRHKVNHCTILAREDATQAADAQKLVVASRFTRPATPTEIILHNHIGTQPAPTDGEPVETLVTGSPAWRIRAINNLNPDNS